MSEMDDLEVVTNADGYVSDVHGVGDWKVYPDIHNAINGLIDRIMAEMERVWGPEGLQGTQEEYAWLQQHYGISEADDVRWQYILQDSMDDLTEDDLSEDDPDDEELIDLLAHPGGIIATLNALLLLYRRNSISYPRDSKD